MKEEVLDGRSSILHSTLDDLLFLVMMIMIIRKKKKKKKMKDFPEKAETLPRTVGAALAPWKVKARV